MATSVEKQTLTIEQPQNLILDDILDLLGTTLVDRKLASEKIGAFLSGLTTVGDGVKCPKPEDVWHAFLESEVDSESEERLAYTLSLINLLRTIRAELGLPVDDTRRRSQREERFTQDNIEINGTPERSLALSLLSGSIKPEDSDNPDTFTGQLVALGFKIDGERHNEFIDRLKKYESIQGPLNEYFVTSFPKVKEVFDRKRDGERADTSESLSPNDVKELFILALDELKAENHEWDDWEIVLLPNKDLLVANCRQQKIKIGADRRPMNIDEAEGLFRHEVLVHALRSINGARISEDFALGLVGYLPAEEGLGVLVEFAKNGDSALKKHFDRYTDIALALGMFTDKPIPKDKLTEILIQRERERVKAGEVFNEDEAMKKLTPHINRIYRGSEGDDIVGVFTKDIAYLDGLIKIMQYILDRINKGDNINDIMDYLLSGKFDPTNQVHVKEHEKSK